MYIIHVHMYIYTYICDYMCIFICFQIFFQKASPFFLKAMASVLPLTSQVRAGAYGHQIASGLVIPTMGQSLKMRLIS